MAIANDGTPGDWLDRNQKAFFKVRDLGKEMLYEAANKGKVPMVTKQFIRDLSDVVTANKESKELLDKFQGRLVTDASFMIGLKRYIDALREFNWAMVGEVLPFMCVKALLEMYATYEMGADTGTSTAVKGGWNAKPKVVGVGAGVELDKNSGIALSVKESLKPILIPAIEFVDQCIRVASPLNTLATPDVVRLWARGYLTEDRASDLVSLHGDVWEEWKQLATLSRDMPSPEMVIEFGRRAGKGAEWISNKLQEVGVTDPEDREITERLFDEIPPVTDLLRFAQRNVTFPEIVQRFGLSDEFDRFWQGQLEKGLTAQGISKDWAELYWRAHWVTASVGLAQESLRRLRPGRVAKALEFTGDDFANVMRENDILPFWRGRMQALSYNPISIRYLREMFMTHAINDQEALDYFQDIGYTLPDAKKFLKSMTTLRKRKDAADGHGYTVPEIAKLYSDHAITFTKFNELILALDYSQEQVRALESKIALDRRIVKQKAYIAALEKGYTAGAISLTDAKTELTNLGYNADEVNEYIVLWDIVIRSHTHTTSLTELATWFKHGLLSPAQFQQRLKGIGLDTDDANRTIMTIVADMKAANAKQVKAQLAKAAAAQVKAAKILAAQQKLAALRFTHNQRVKERIAVAADHEVFAIKEAAIVQQLKDLIADIPKGPKHDKAVAAEQAKHTDDVAAQAEREKTSIDLSQLT